MKYIFLDIDGVISTFNESMSSTKDFWDSNPWAKDMRVLYPFNQDCVMVLNEIIKETDAEIILSSDWKKQRTLEELDIIFKKNGIIKSPIDKTKNLRDEYSNFETCRSMEITHYIGENIITDYIILDDLNLESLLPFRVRERFFRTDWEGGLGESGLKGDIIFKLNN